MDKRRRANGRWIGNGKLTAALLAAAGCLFMVFGFQQPRDAEPAGWIRLDGALAEALGSGASGDEGRQQETDGASANGETGKAGLHKSELEENGTSTVTDGSQHATALEKDKAGAPGADADSGQPNRDDSSGADGVSSNGAAAEAQTANAAEGQTMQGAAGDERTGGGSIDGVGGSKAFLDGSGSIGARDGEEASAAGQTDVKDSPDRAAGDKEAAGGGSTSGGYTAEGKLDLNRATTAQLEDLPGIGPAKAKAIVEDRERNGPFPSVEAVERVKGIGPKLIAKWKNIVVV